jgi:cystine transport system substrate-binding protein
MPDGLPVLGPSSTTPGLVHAFGFSGHGFQLGPAVGAVLSELVLTGESQTPIEGLSIKRFRFPHLSRDVQMPRGRHGLARVTTTRVTTKRGERHMLEIATHGLRGFALSAMFLFGCLSNGALAEDYKLVEKGVLSVAITGDMPGLVAREGKLVGYDGEILAAAAADLGLKIKPVPMEWSGAVAAVQAGRVDLIGGNVAWTEQRAKILALTDPTGYFQNGITQREGTNWHTLADLEGKKVGSMTGFAFLPELRKIRGLELSLYDTSDAAIRDLLNGRIDALVGDPPVIDYGIAQNSDWKLRNVPFSDNNPDFPLLTGVGRQYVFGLSQENKSLANALSSEIRKMWETCKVKAIGKSYGNVNEANYTPSPTNVRVGVDRQEGWVPPTCK